MMALLCITLFLFLFLTGKAALKILYRTGKRGNLFWEDELLTGGILLTGLAAAAHLGAMVCGWSVSAVTKLFALMLLALLLVSLGILGVAVLLDKRTKTPGKQGMESADGKKAAAGSFGKKAADWWKSQLTSCSRKEAVVLGISVVILLYQVGCILLPTKVYVDADLTLETVKSFQLSDQLYALNPLNGLPFQEGLPSRLKILCLSTLYTMLSSLFSVDAEVLVWRAVPVMVLCGSCLAYISLGRILFPENRLNRRLFLAFVLLLFCVGDYLYGMEGFGLLHGGWQGTTIRNAVLLPWLLGLVIRKKWVLILGVILVEACIVWTTYGAGMGVLLTVVCLLTELVGRHLHGRKEESL